MTNIIFARLTPKPNGMKHLSGAPLQGRLLASLTNIRLGWRGLPGTNTLAYYDINYDRKKFYSTGGDCFRMKLSKRQ